jgi:hypothetical protein
MRHVFEGDALHECPSLHRILAASSFEGTKLASLAMRRAMLFVHGGSGVDYGVVCEERVQPYSPWTSGLRDRAPQIRRRLVTAMGSEVRVHWAWIQLRTH